MSEHAKRMKRELVMKGTILVYSTKNNQYALLCLCT